MGSRRHEALSGEVGLKGEPLELLAKGFEHIAVGYYRGERDFLHPAGDPTHSRRLGTLHGRGPGGGTGNAGDAGG